MAVSFGEWIHKMLATHAAVSIGEGENKLVGEIAAYDEQHAVVTFQAGRTSHFIPLSSIRSIGYEETDLGPYCYLELFKR